MKRLLVAILLWMFALSANAVGVLIPTASKTDMVYDELRDVVYISNGSQILRYHLGTNVFLSPISLTGVLGGIDISPDNRYLIAAEQTGSQNQSWMYVVDLSSLTSQIAVLNTPTNEGSFFTVAYGADGKIYTTSNTASGGSAWHPLRRYDRQSGVWTDLLMVSNNTMLSVSGDGQTIAFADGLSPMGWGIVDVPTGSVMQAPYGASGGTPSDIGVDRFGAQIAIPTYSGTFVYDDAFVQSNTIGDYAGIRPQGIAYHPVERLAYMPFSLTSELRIFDMNTMSQVGSFDLESTFSRSSPIGWFGEGHTRISRDGSLLLVSMPNGVRAIRQYAPLAAPAQNATVNLNQPKAISLMGSVGNGGALTYALINAPTRGSASMSGNVVTYTPGSGYLGADSFKYRVTYGRASQEGTVSITVVDPNRAPIAVNDQAQTRNTAISISVLANDSDPDGDPLSIVSATQPTQGTLVIVGSQIRFSPPKKWTANSATFDYTIRDPNWKQATARVTVIKN